MEIREARTSDWPAVSTLLAELGRPDVRDRDDEESHRDRFERYLARPDTAALVAADGEHVIGFVNVEFRPRLNFRAPQAWVPELIVSETARSRGAGKALLDAVEELAREHDCFALTLESAVWRTRAHAFYEREGLSRVAGSFAKSLGGEGDQWPPRPRLNCDKNPSRNRR